MCGSMIPLTILFVSSLEFNYVLYQCIVLIHQFVSMICMHFTTSRYLAYSFVLPIVSCPAIGSSNWSAPSICIMACIPVYFNASLSTVYSIKGTAPFAYSLLFNNCYVCSTQCYKLCKTYTGQPLVRNSVCKQIEHNWKHYKIKRSNKIVIA